EHPEQLEISPPNRGVLPGFVRPFQLNSPPLLRTALFVDNRGVFLLVDMHHIISDGISLQTMEKDLLRLYENEQLTPLRIQYKDYAQWQNAPEQKELISRQEHYWLKEFEGETPLLKMPLDFPRPEKFNFEGGTVTFRIDSGHTAELKELAVQTTVTPMMILLAVFKILLLKYTGQQDIVVGTVVAGRRHTDLENLIGFFVNMLGIKTTPRKELLFRDYLPEVKKKAIQAYDNQDYQFEELVGKLEIPRQPGRHPLIDMVFVFSEAPGETNEGTESEAAVNNTEIPEDNPLKVSHFDMMLHVTDNGGTMTGVIEYSTALFKKETIEGIAGFYEEILKQVLKNPIIKLQEITSGHTFETVKKTVLDSALDFDI
ncbi:MAG: non-ribosomal peptide synthetase, partial [bacterium]|nr:non-ribosomal peptide synthetase [bacterium]